MLDELVALFVGRKTKEGSFSLYNDVVNVFVVLAIEGIAEFAVQRLLAS
jgi:hypothetical protein